MRSNSRALTIDEVRARFEEWRKNRQGKSPIPDELWSAAAQLACKDGINRTAAALHLDGGKLKQLMEEKTTPGKPAPAFVELLTPRAISILECITCIAKIFVSFRQRCVNALVVRNSLKKMGPALPET